MPPAGSQDVGAVIGSLAASIRMGRFPWWYPAGAKDKAIEYGVLGSDWTPLTASLTIQNNINVSGEAAFIILAATLVETATDNTTFLANRPLLADIIDTGSNRKLSNTPIHVDNWFGTAENPMWWPVPKILAPNSTLGVALQNLEATDRNVRVAFHGFKVYGFQVG